MKNFIYIDTKLINSMLAQLDQGLVLKHAVDTAMTETNQEDGGKEEKQSVSTGLNLVVNGGYTYDTTEIDKYSLVYSTTNSQLIETAIDDYAFDLLLDKIKDQVKEELDIEDGDFIQRIATPSFYDFNKLKHAINTNELAKLFPELFSEVDSYKKELEKLSKANKEKHKSKIAEIENLINDSAPENLRKLFDLSSYLSDLYDNSKLAKIGDTICICENEYLRVTPSLLSIMNMSNKKATVIGTVVARIKEGFDLTSLGAMPANDVLSNTSNMFMDLISSSFGISQRGDYYVRPIAIYFE